MRRCGNCHDIAVAENFFNLLKRERLRQRTYKTRVNARRDVFDYIEMFYNPTRKHARNRMLQFEHSSDTKMTFAPLKGRRTSLSAFKGRHVVVVSPIALIADSRTVKQVISLHRWGAYVTVIAGGHVATGSNVAAELLVATPHVAISERTRPIWIEKVWSWVRKTELSAVLLSPIFAAWLGIFFWRTYVNRRLKIPSGADLYILHEFSHFPAVASAAKGKPIVYETHDFYTEIEPDDLIGSFDRNLLNPFSRWLERLCIQRAMQVVTVSSGLSEIYQRAYGVKPAVIRNCHDFRLDARSIPNLRTRLGLSSDQFIIAVIGNWKAGQRFAPLLSALTCGPKHIHLALIGAGYERLQDEIDSAGLVGRIHMPGRLSPTELVPSVVGADAAAILYYDRSDNYKFALPNGFFQSIAAGLPMLYPDLPEIRRIADKFKLGTMVDWADEKKIGAALDLIAHDTCKQTHWRKNAKKASDSFTWEQEERLWGALLVDCLLYRI